MATRMTGEWTKAGRPATMGRNDPTGYVPASEVS